MLQLARRTHLKREIGGIALLLAAVFIAGSLLAGGASDGQSCSDAATIFGPVGACLRSSILLTLGALCAVIVPFIPAVHALRLLGRPAIEQVAQHAGVAVGDARVVEVAPGRLVVGQHSYGPLVAVGARGHSRPIIRMLAPTT